MQMGVGQVTQIGDGKTHATYLNFSVELKIINIIKEVEKSIVVTRA